MDLSFVKKVEEANVITRGGKFDLDEIMSIVILSKLFEIRLLRVEKLPDSIPKGAIVLKLGDGPFCEEKSSSVCVKLWNAVGSIYLKHENVSNKETVWSLINDWILGIEKNAKTCKKGSLYEIIEACNLTQNQNKKCQNNEYFFAVSILESAFSIIYQDCIVRANAKEIVDNCIKYSDEGIVFLEQSVPWEEWFFKSDSEKAKNAKFIVFPTKKGFFWNAIPIEQGSSIYRATAPKKAWGLRTGKLRTVTHLEDAMYCNVIGTKGWFKTLDGVITFLEKTMNNDYG